MAQVKEKTAIEHYKKNYDLHLDYLVVIKHDLKGEIILDEVPEDYREEVNKKVNKNNGIRWCQYI